MADPDLLAIERAAVRGWPAFETHAIDGWLARWASGGSVRANSVAALDWTGGDLDVAIARVVDFYRRRDAVPRFTICDASAPEGLDDALDRAGWVRRGDHVTMAKWVGPDRESAPDVMLLDRPGPAWLAVYLEGLSHDRLPVAARLVAGVPAPRKLFAAYRDGGIVASGMSVLDGALASVQCMATLPRARRTGAAAAVLAAIEDWAAGQGARRLYLQTDAANEAAISLYRKAGFTIAGRYHTRDLPS